MTRSWKLNLRGSLQHWEMSRRSLTSPCNSSLPLPNMHWLTQVCGNTKCCNYFTFSFICTLYHGSWNNRGFASASACKSQGNFHLLFAYTICCMLLNMRICMHVRHLALRHTVLNWLWLRYTQFVKHEDLSMTLTDTVQAVSPKGTVLPKSGTLLHNSSSGELSCKALQSRWQNCWNKNVQEAEVGALCLHKTELKMHDSFRLVGITTSIQEPWNWAATRMQVHRFGLPLLVCRYTNLVCRY